MNLSTTYLGLKLRTPLVPAASPLSEDLDNLKRMEDAGASAVVFHSLFEEQIRHESETLFARLKGTDSLEEVLSYFPEPDEFHFGPGRYLLNLVKAKQALCIPIIASLNGTSFGGRREPRGSARLLSRRAVAASRRRPRPGPPHSCWRWDGKACGIPGCKTCNFINAR